MVGPLGTAEVFIASGIVGRFESVPAFPTFDFPAKATSGLPVSGILLVMPQTISSDTFLITIRYSSLFF